MTTLAHRRFEHPHLVTAVAVTACEGGDVFWYAAVDGHIWSLDPGRESFARCGRVEGYVRSLSISPRGLVLATTDESAYILTEGLLDVRFDLDNTVTCDPVWINGDRCVLVTGSDGIGQCITVIDVPSRTRRDHRFADYSDLFGVYAHSDSGIRVFELGTSFIHERVAPEFHIERVSPAPDDGLPLLAGSGRYAVFHCPASSDDQLPIEYVDLQHHRICELPGVVADWSLTMCPSERTPEVLVSVTHSDTGNRAIAKHALDTGQLVWRLDIEERSLTHMTLSPSGTLALLVTRERVLFVEESPDICGMVSLSVVARHDVSALEIHSRWAQSRSEHVICAIDDQIHVISRAL